MAEFRVLTLVQLLDKPRENKNGQRAINSLTLEFEASKEQNVPLVPSIL
jgi:hypothetical protein